MFRYIAISLNEYPNHLVYRENSQTTNQTNVNFLTGEGVGHSVQHSQTLYSTFIFREGFKKGFHLYDVLLCVIDINECADSTPDCDVNAVCNNILGSYKCMCEDGFHGNGTNCTGNLL